MHAYLRRALCAAGLAGGLVLLGVGLAEAASADGSNGPVTTGQNGVASGNQTAVGAQAPINASGNQVTVIGQRNHNTSTSTSRTGTSSGSGSSGSPTTSGQSGIGSGNQTAVHVHAPVNATGNQVTVIGQDNTNRAAGGTSTTAPSAASGGSSGSPTTSGRSGIASGNQTGVDAQAPINASGNQVTVIGQDNTLNAVGASSSGTSPSGGSTTSGAPTTSGESGIGSGNQTGLALAVPVDVSGNQVTVIGQDNTLGSRGGSTTGSTSGTGTSGAPTTSGESGILSGNQTGIGATAPVAVTGNQVTVIGQDNTLTSTGGSSTGGGSSSNGETTTGAGGIGSGNQTPIEVQAPVDTSGNQVTVIGQDNTDTSTSGSGSGGSGGTTPGGPVVSPPSGGVTSPPSGGTATNVSQGASAPGTSVLPNTGLPRGLLWLALLGMVLVGLGSVLTRRTPARARC